MINAASFQQIGEFSPRITCYKSIKLMAINVNSLETNVRRYNLQTILEKLNPDIALISETKLSDSHKLSFKNTKYIEMIEQPTKEEVAPRSLLKITSNKYQIR